MSESPREKPTSFWTILGLLIGLLIFDLGRVVAVVGALGVAALALMRSVDAGANEWVFLAIAGGTFSAIAWACRR